MSEIEYLNGIDKVLLPAIVFIFKSNFTRKSITLIKTGKSEK